VNLSNLEICLSLLGRFFSVARRKIIAEEMEESRVTSQDARGFHGSSTKRLVNCSDPSCTIEVLLYVGQFVRKKHFYRGIYAITGKNTRVTFYIGRYGQQVRISLRTIGTNHSTR
jgi:hypothetical protein